MRELITVVEDEVDILEVVLLHLNRSQYSTKGFYDIKSFKDFLQKKILPDLIILDLMLPDGDGFELCKELKSSEKYSSIPVIMLTARAEETDKVLGLELGADDYVTKPFSPKELVARVKAVLRRKKAPEKVKRIDVGGVLTIDQEKHQVLVKNNPVELTMSEFKILWLLSSHISWVYSRDQILEYLWGQDKVVIDRTVDVHVKHLRGKLGDVGAWIKNVRGVGYKIEEP